MKIGIIELRILLVVMEILVFNISWILKRKIKSIIEKIIENYLLKGYNYEVVWVLWMCVEFLIKIRNKMVEKIFVLNDYVLMLIVMDLKSRNLINVMVSIDGFLFELIEEFLMNENWLFFYELIKKGWLNFIDNLIDENKYFKILFDNGIYFYWEDVKVEIYIVKKLIEKVVEFIIKFEVEDVKIIVFGGGGGGSIY